MNISTSGCKLGLTDSIYTAYRSMQEAIAGRESRLKFDVYCSFVHSKL